MNRFLAATIALAVLAGVAWLLAPVPAGQPMQTPAEGDVPVPFRAEGRDGLWGYRAGGRVVIGPRFYAAEPFHDGLAIATAVQPRPDGRPGGGLRGFVDIRGEWAVAPRFAALRPFADGLAPAAAPATGSAPLRWGFIDEGGDWAIAPRFVEVADFSEGLARVQPGEDREQVGFVTTSGEWAVAPALRGAGDFVAGLAPARRGDAWGYIDRHGTWVVPPRFDGASGFVGGRAVVLLDERLHFVDRDGALTGEVFDHAVRLGALPDPTAPGDEGGTAIDRYAHVAIGGARDEYTVLIHPVHGEQWDVWTVAPLRDGAVFVVKGGWEWATRVLMLPGVTCADADALARRLAGMDGATEAVENPFGDDAGQPRRAWRTADEHYYWAQAVDGGCTVHHFFGV